MLGENSLNLGPTP